MTIAQSTTTAADREASPLVLRGPAMSALDILMDYVAPKDRKKALKRLRAEVREWTPRAEEHPNVIHFGRARSERRDPQQHARRIAENLAIAESFAFLADVVRERMEEDQ